MKKEVFQPKQHIRSASNFYIENWSDCRNKLNHSQGAFWYHSLGHQNRTKTI